MDKLRILVVENRANWLEELPKVLQRVGNSPLIDLAVTFDRAVEYLTRDFYDLAVIDLALTDSPTDTEARDEKGMELVRRLRSNRQNEGCGVIILTGYPSSERTRRALRDYTADDFMEKDKFSSADFLVAARRAIGAARLRRASQRSAERYRLTISFSREHLTGVSLVGPDRRVTYWAQEQRRFAAADLARRADNLNLLILQGGADLWRPEARSIGEAIGEAMANDRHIFGELTAAKAHVAHLSDLWLEFSGPAEGLGIPFELLRDEVDYLVLSHMMTRRLDSSGFPASRKPEPYLGFIQHLIKRHEPLRVLLVAANSDGNIPAVETEVAAISTIIRTGFEQIGIKSEIDVLSGDQATLDVVADRLRSRVYHLFHYAGHGRFDDKLPETSGLVFCSGANTRVLTASDLNLLMRDTDLRMVFLSACVSARSAERAGRGDFYGIMEALARADVPIVVGYRWTVGDEAALQIAETFYRELWRTLSPAEALLETRRWAAMGPRGRDEDSWASPVMLMQNG